MNTPHFNYPFRRNSNGSVAEVEQDSIDDVTNAAMTVMKTVVGSRIELPDFGVPDLPLKENGPSIQQLMTALNAWEPRASYVFTVDEIVDMCQRITITTSGISGA